MSDAADCTEQAFVVIIGSGVAGSFMASQFAARGFPGVLVLEAGPAIPMGDPAWWFHHVARGGGTSNTPYATCYDSTSDFSATGDNPWNIVGGRIMGRGGTTLHWGGWIPRYMPEDFRLRSNTGLGIDWPYTYQALEPYYCMAEKYFGASGDSADQSPPRSQPYPYDAAPYPISAGPFISAFQRMSLSYTHLPVARYGKASGELGPCRTTGTCDYCPVAGRFTGDQPLDLLRTAPRVTVRTGAAVTAIRMRNKQQVAGVTYLDLSTGQRVDVDAQLVIVCTGAFEAPKLLLASTSPYWPYGIGNQTEVGESGHFVGKFLCATQFFYSSGTRANPLAFQEELGFPSLCSRAFDTPATQRMGKLFLTMNYETPNVDLADLMSKGQQRADLLAARVAAAPFQLYGNLSALPQAANRVSLASGATRFGLPRTAITTPAPLYDPGAAAQYMELMNRMLSSMGCIGVTAGTYPQRGDHAACTTRMASDASQGVVGPDLRVFGVDNLYIASNSVMPTLPAANPTLTLIAMLYKLASGGNALADMMAKQAPEPQEAR